MLFANLAIAIAIDTMSHEEDSMRKKKVDEIEPRHEALFDSVGFID